MYNTHVVLFYHAEIKISNNHSRIPVHLVLYFIPKN